MDQWVEEVLFRGRPPSGQGSDQPPRLHVIIGVQADDPLIPGEKTRRTLGPMDMTTAKKFGYTPALLVAEINTSLSERVQELEAEILAIKQQHQEEITNLTNGVDENIK